MTSGDVVAIAEHRRGELREVSLELVSAGRDLADASGGDLHVVVVSGDVDEFAAQLDREGADRVLTVDHGEEFNHDVYAQVASQLVDQIDPAAVLAPHSVNALDYAPAVANALDLPLVTDAIDLEADGDALTATREMYGSKVETVLEVPLPALVTIRSGEWPPAEGAGSAQIEAFDADIDEGEIGSTVSGFEEAGGGDVDITEAELLVSIGRGIEDEDNLDLIFDLAEALGGTLSASRPLIDNGWLPKDRQVGQSGKTVEPEIYIAIGISGAVQHIAGMKNAGTIIAVNTDPNAPIFDFADYGIVGDLFDVVPELIDQFA